MKNPTVGLILSGGSGLRLGGVRKGDLRIGNIALKDTLAGALAGQCLTLFYSTGAARTLPPAGAIALPDDPDGITGPAAGLLAGALWCIDNAPDALMATVSVDTPFYPTDFISRATPLMGLATGCVVAQYGARDYPTIALWRPGPLSVDLKSIRPAPRGPRLRDIERRLGAVYIDYAETAPENPFEGINTLSDLLSVSKRGRSSV
ncbi:molybdenum cofactor guanylyltransferase [Pelagibacterium luteolum]|uniref:Molybdopterin-guanine dinucleotide biosynthesis protein A n=1 Tax=Pelagibacterium luteolum TaxID=440168 RepID=A0A1G7WAN6_9HYPH|nr:NTP transferase domain-containing protein [Pelagibacterium luteolum]SDG69047.1 molybdopterin-guanine dinucleotide biosynthesis protein A [Pelagibacterium luteolum]